jgi:murein L,D-transpeptidase YcbB/YkuD
MAKPAEDAMARARFVRVTAVVMMVGVFASACSSNKSGKSTTTTDPIAAAEARVGAAQSDLTKAQSTLTEANQAFCADAKTYITAIDRYGKLFEQSAATVGDIKTQGNDLEKPRAAVTKSASDVNDAHESVGKAQQELVAAQAALADAQSSAGTSTTKPAATTTTTIVPPATLTRVEQAESEFAKAAAGITDQTPLHQADVVFNSAAFALEISWLQLFADAGCLTTEQEKEAVTKVHDYTVALQNELKVAGYYKGNIDGVYGPETVAAVEQLQQDASLPVTGLVDKATAAALDAKLTALGGAAAGSAHTQTVAVQTTLKLAGYWTGPIDGTWTPELTTALKKFQTALGVPATGAVDAATLAALETAIANLKSPPTTSGPSSPSTTG